MKRGTAFCVVPFAFRMAQWYNVKVHCNMEIFHYGEV